MTLEQTICFSPCQAKSTLYLASLELVILNFETREQLEQGVKNQEQIVTTYS